jgi:hypothetical protein
MPKKVTVSNLAHFNWLIIIEYLSGTPIALTLLPKTGDAKLAIKNKSPAWESS